ncbi:MAG: response regulator transcription factor [Pseudobutyrivibrio sp.]|nr:response regulator transcription factor [Pseudobutyrivibrio sp.]
MIQAAIVEDEEQIRSYLKNTLILAFEAKQLHVAFDSFSTGDSFLSMFDSHYHFDIIFLDIEMPQMDGITLCKKIREVSPDALVVFISNKDELVFQTFEVQPFRFIRKSEYNSQLPKLVDDLITQLNKNNTKFISFKDSSGDIFSFDVQKILYIEAQRKNCRIVLDSDERLIPCKLMDLESSLSSYAFIKPHRSYLVNCKHIYYIGKNDIRLSNNETIPISRGKTEEVKQLFLDYTTR